MILSLRRGCDAAKDIGGNVRGRLHSGPMPFSAPHLGEHLVALRAAGVVIPKRPFAVFPPSIIVGWPPTPEEVAADMAYQRAIQTWIDDVERLYFQHFGIAQR